MNVRPLLYVVLYRVPSVSVVKQYGVQMCRDDRHMLMSNVTLSKAAFTSTY